MTDPIIILAFSFLAAVTLIIVLKFYFDYRKEVKSNFYSIELNPEDKLFVEIPFETNEEALRAKNKIKEWSGVDDKNILIMNSKYECKITVAKSDKDIDNLLKNCKIQIMKGDMEDVSDPKR